MNEEQAEEAEEVADVLMRGVHPRMADLDRAQVIGEARKNAQQLNPLSAKLLVALEDAHARLARLEK